MEAFVAFTTVAGLMSLFTLTLMEIVLGIDNIVFISIVAGKLPKAQQPRARSIGLLMALAFRIMLLFTITWLVGLTEPLFTFDLFGLLEEPLGIGVKDLILIGGGLFLIAKSVSEMHHKLEGAEEEHKDSKAAKSMTSVILQIVMVDIVFSFDSILTAVGLTKDLAIMVAAVVISMGIMLAFAGKISDFINRRPTMKMLALAFLILIGFMLVLEGLHQHVDKGYIYFGMAFAFVVEILNGRLRKKSDPVKLHDNVPE
ncbi:TerC family protein [Pontibacter sp. G13]|uniref:TerC family protein n=1 Tax=Pontibacter sp. G13 TaxID=3074898 RepID=UPI00288AD2F9|nr:TerC family protein [Pontibacter sp. G13]WNJ21040.1 TerC family protein [Pontibacter sp. G13]